METFYASAARTSNESIRESFLYIQSHTDAVNLINALQYFVLILNENRQVVYTNKTLTSFLNADIEDTLGKRPGELVNCKYSGEMKWGCGTSKNCRFCGAVNSILESHTSENAITKDCRILSSKGDIWTNFEFSVTSSNLTIGDKTFTLFTLTDISDKKRRLALEKVFFHDIINTAGSLIGVLELLRESDQTEKHHKLLNIASSVGQELIDEIVSQRQILDAENDKLVTNLRPCSSLHILNQVVSRMTHHDISKNKIISIDEGSVDIEFITDHKIIKRIMVNMAKNALEAITNGEEVILKAATSGGKIIFSTYNPGHIPEDIQLQIFHRTFSTKGENRGLGTYSMKMHAEKYLNGKIYFRSNTGKGTTFYCELPLIEK